MAIVPCYPESIAGLPVSFDTRIRSIDIAVFQSMNEDVAVVDYNGRVVAVGEGNTTILVEAIGYDSFEVPVEVISNQTGVPDAENVGEIDINSITPDNLPLEFVKKYLRVDHSFDDLEIMIHITNAQAYVRDYIKIPDDEEMGKGLLAPVLTLTAYFYENKSALMKSTEKLDSVFGSILSLHRQDVV